MRHKCETVNRNNTRRNSEKQTGGFIMKTNFKTNRKQISETVLKSFIAIITLILSASVNGQDFWTSNNPGYFEPATIRFERHNGLTPGSSYLSLYAESTETEQALELESWMVKNANFGTFINLEKELEKAMELENWMVDARLFKVNFESESENELELEGWMTNELHFQPNITEEEPMELEPWMIADNFGGM